MKTLYLITPRGLTFGDAPKGDVLYRRVRKDDDPAHPFGYLDGDSIWAYDGRHLAWFEAGYVMTHDGHRLLWTNLTKDKHPMLQTLTIIGKRQPPPEKEPRQDKPEPPKRWIAKWSDDDPDAVLGISR